MTITTLKTKTPSLLQVPKSALILLLPFSQNSLTLVSSVFKQDAAWEKRQASASQAT